MSWVAGFIAFAVVFGGLMAAQVIFNFVTPWWVAAILVVGFVTAIVLIDKKKSGW